MMTADGLMKKMMMMGVKRLGIPRVFIESKHCAEAVINAIMINRNLTDGINALAGNAH
jgi:hypothetical protein